MLEHLGLGIQLSLEDDFTPQSQNALNSFQRLQHGAEEMSSRVSDSMSDMNANVSKQMMSLQNLMLAGFSFDQIGRKLDNFGRSVLETFKKIHGAVAETGAKFDNIRSQFKTVFGKSEIESNLKWATDFSIVTPFQVEDTARAMSGLKAVGLDVKKAFKDVNGEMKPFLQFVGDLSTRNMSDTGGIKGMMLALSNLAGGQPKSLQARFDIPKSEIDKLKGLEGDDLMEAFVDMAKKLTPNAMGNMIGTWDQILAEMEDKWDVFLWKLGDTGAFDVMKRSLKRLDNALAYLATNADLDALGGVLKSLWAPVDLVARGIAGIAKGLIDVSSKHPLLMKIVLTMIAFGGATAVAVGSLMKFTGSIIVGVASVGSLLLNMKLMNQMFGWKLPISIGKTVGAFKWLIGMSGVLALVGTGLYFGWTNNMFGIASASTKYVHSIEERWANARQLLSRPLITNNSIPKPVTETEMYLDNLTEKFLKLQAIGMILGEVIFGKIGKDNKFEFSSGTTLAIINSGLRDFAESAVMAKLRFDMFWKGVKDGLGIVLSYGKALLDIVLIPIKGVLKVLGVEFNPLIAWISGKSNGGKSDDYWNRQLQNFRTLGTILGGIVGTLATLKLYSSLGRIISKPFKMMSRSVDNASTKVSKLKLLMGSLSPKKYLDGMTGGMFSRTKNYLNKHASLPQTFEDRNRLGVPKNLRGRRVRLDTLNTSYRDNILSKKDLSHGVYTKRGGAVAKLFGQKYVDGRGNDLGRFGGLLHINRDDRQLRLGYQNAVNKGTIPERIKPSDYITGRVKTKEKDAQGHFKYKNVYDTQAYKRDMSRYAGRPQKSLGNEVMKLKNIRGFSQTNPTNALASSKALEDAKQAFLSDPKMIAKYGAAKSTGIVDRRKLSMRNGTDLQGFISQSPQARAILSRDIGGQGNASVYKAKRNKFAKALLGDKFYTINTDENGVMRRQTVARRGGILRSASNDMQYTDPSRPTWMGQKVKAGKDLASKGWAHTKSIPKRVFSPIGNVINEKYEGSRLQQGISRVGDFSRGVPIRGFINNQRARFGLQPLAEGESSPKGFKNRARQVAGFGGRVLLGRQTYDTAGNSAGRRGGLLGFAKGTAKLGGGVMRGAGALAGGLLRALPMAGLVGSMALGGWRALSTAQGKDGKQVTGAQGAVMNINKMKEKLSSMNFNEVWENFKGGAKTVFSAVASLGKDVWNVIKENAGQVFGEMWEGIKILASSAWEYIKENGSTHLQSLISWIITDGVPMAISGICGILKWLGGTFLPTALSIFGKVMGWFITDGFKLAITGLGKLLKWIATDFVPTAIGWLKGIAGGVIDGIKGAINGMWRAIKKSLPDWLVRLFGGSASVTVTDNTGGNKGGPKGNRNKGTKGPKGNKPKTTKKRKHHGGLWLSEDEHEAIIRKDETVLPPNISRKLNASLSQDSSSGSGNPINIAKVEVNVNASKLSRAEAREQALMILEELKKLGKEKAIRNYSDMPSLSLGI